MCPSLKLLTKVDWQQQAEYYNCYFLNNSQWVRVHFIYKLVKLFLLGPGLIFVVYAEGLSTMPAAPFWSIWFYFMISLLGFTSQVSGSFTCSRIAMWLHSSTNICGYCCGVWSVRSGRGLLHGVAGRVPRVPETRTEAGHPAGGLLHHHLSPRPAHGHRGDMWQVLSPAVTSLSIRSYWKQYTILL